VSPSNVQSRSEQRAPRPWQAQRWEAVAESLATEEAMKLGRSLHRRARTRVGALERGRITARVSERPRRGFDVSISVQVFTEDQWTRVVRVLGDSSLLRSRLEIGVLPEGVEEALDSLALSIAPRAASDTVTRCTCGNASPGVWCEHLVAVALEVADRVESDPLSLFELRGMAREDLLARLAAVGAASGGVRTGSTILTPVLSDLEAMRSSPLEETIDRFWESPVRADVGNLSRQEDTRKVLLRRLGASPFTESRFPLLGLLATVYDLFGAHGRDEEADAEAEGGEASGAGDEPDSLTEAD